MPWGALAFALGVFAVQQLAVLPAPSWIASVALAGLALWLTGRRGWALAGAGLMGFAWAAGFAHWRLADALPAEWQGRDIRVTGRVSGLPQAFERGVRFVFEVEAADGPAPKRLLLSWYRRIERIEEEAEEEADFAALPVPRGGERWRLVVRLKRPHGNLNPHGFDYEAWLFERGVRATGYVRPSVQNARVAPAGLSIDAWREGLRARLMRALPEAPYAGIVAALAIGDQQAVPNEQWRLFAATGITHLMSISGLHVTMIGALLGSLVFAFWRRHPRLPLMLPAQQAAAVAGWLGAAAYALIAGFGVPAQRTLYMGSVVVLGLFSGRALAAGQVLGAALVLVLLIDPWAVLAAGFWLSFGAVALLFYISAGRLAYRHWLIEAVRAQWAILVGLTPALLALFGQFSLVAPLANAVAIPLVSFVITPLALLGSLPGLAWAYRLAHALLEPLMEFLGWLASLPGALWWLPAPPIWAVLLALAGAAWLLAPRGWPARWAGLMLFLPLFLLRPERPEAGGFLLTVLDVGQGQAIHVQTARHDLLFDAGPAYGQSAEAGGRIVVPYLRAAGVARLDKLIVSHDDRDHAGGAEAVVAALPVETVERRCIEGESWTWDGVRFRVLHPPAANYDRKGPANALSCVLKIEAEKGSALIPADLEGPAERAFLARHAADAQSEILIAPHHGGKKTASPAFVAAVAPREVVFSVGYRNRFGHPHPEVLARFAGARVHRTDRDGAVSFKVGAGGTAIRHEREARRRYWHNSAP
ncbi:MAG: DNA internalization-related competence protein ComEC/Rec2 [Rhodocyclaceae bacterium]|nr:DNA internalization-related competence protein ComEC/Rec2 [Rhodocyclaceae bacterium]